jgi:hypothetical protein
MRNTLGAAPRHICSNLKPRFHKVQRTAIYFGALHLQQYLFIKATNVTGLCPLRITRL